MHGMAAAISMSRAVTPAHLYASHESCAVSVLPHLSLPSLHPLSSSVTYLVLQHRSLVCERLVVAECNVGHKQRHNALEPLLIQCWGQLQSAQRERERECVCVCVCVSMHV